MSEIHVRQLQHYFLNSISEKIDMNDVSKGKNKEDIEQIKLSRSLTAFAISGITGVHTSITANFVLDGERSGYRRMLL